MDNKDLIKNEDLEKVSGGLDTVFYGDIPICPTCGERNIKKISGNEYEDTYQCHNCGMVSVHIKKERPAPVPIHPELQCMICGSIGQWDLISSAGGIDTVKCQICRNQTTTSAE